MKRNYFIYIFSLLFFNFSLAQKEASFWYFGENAGLDFTSGFPVSNLEGSLNTVEGCASISGANGNLLFYTDGVTVWNRNHKVMPTGSGLFGNASSSQSAIIVPKPADPNIYYIFTVDWSQGTNGLNYYTVDLTLDNGLGDVIGNNNVPTATKLLSSPTSEKITAVKVLDEDAFWVISLNTNRFYVYKVDTNGVKSTPVSGNNDFFESQDPRGYLKSSPDGTKLVSANMASGTFIYDFDSELGLVSNERRLDLLDNPGYGVEFSPLSKKLYISTGNFDGTPTQFEERLFQFNVDFPDPSSENINNSRVELHSYVNTRAALQLGVDGKIYRAIYNSSSLGVISNPEGDGFAANYIHEAINLSGRLSKQGLPPFIQSFFAAIVEVDNLCFGGTTQFTIQSNEPILSITWDFGDNSPQSNLLNPSHLYTSAGEYTITVTVTTSDETKIITQNITIFDIPNIDTEVTLLQCDDNTDGISSFNLTESEFLINVNNQSLQFSYFLSEEDANTSEREISNFESFSNASTSRVFARVENQLGCFVVAEINLTVSISQIPENFQLSFIECDNDLVDNDSENGITTFDFSEATNSIIALFPSDQNLTVAYYENIESALKEVNKIDPSNYRNENSPFLQQIVARVDNQSNNACVGLGFHIELLVSHLPQFEAPEIKFICVGDQSSVELSVINPFDNYLYKWRNQDNVLLNTDSSTEVIEVFEPGEYSVTAISQDDCEKTKMINVIASSFATNQNIDIVDDSDNNMITVSVSGNGNYEFALDNEDGPYQDDNTFTNVKPGIHMIFVKDKNGCGIISEEVSVIGYPRFFTPNGDGFNDTWQVLGIRVQPESKVIIFDRLGKVIAEIDPTASGWNGTYNGKIMPQSDYWFLAKLEDGRVRRGHFSLIKR